MQNVPLKELKENLSYWAEIAANGETVEITRYNQIYVKMVPALEEGLLVGKNVGKEPLKSIGKNLSKGKWLKALQEDRS